jgi:hypothetical protein
MATPAFFMERPTRSANAKSISSGSFKILKSRLLVHYNLETTASK